MKKILKYTYTHTHKHTHIFHTCKANIYKKIMYKEKKEKTISQSTSTMITWDLFLGFKQG